MTLGVVFKADVAGSVTGVRFYKAQANTGTHIGSLWTTSGTLLASATFTNETTSGWQEVSFSNPVEIVPGTDYIVSYYAPNGHYSVTPNGLGSAVDNPPLYAIANTTSPNGLYAYGVGNTFPSSSYNASSYHVDPTFVPRAPPSGDGGSAITGYTVTPYLGSTAQTPMQVSGGSTTSATVTGLTNGKAYTFAVAAINSVGTGSASAPSAAATPDDTIFDFATPATIDSGDGGGVTVDVKFVPEVSGTVTGILVLQGADQWRRAHRLAVGLERQPARLGDVHERDGLGLAAGDVLQPSPGHCGYHVHRLLLCAGGPLLGHVERVHLGVR